MRDQILKLRRENMSYDDISKKLNIGKGIISYHLKKEGLNNPINNRGSKITNELIKVIEELNDGSITKKEIAKKLGISYGTVKKYTGKTPKKFKTKDELRDKQYEKHRQWRLNIKIKCLKYLGGKCSKCGYNRCVGALDLHHKDSNEKEFGISGGNLKSFDKLIPELNKCEVLCSNCHREYHNKHLFNLL
jgi:DNA-binding CsgD family transcriptional regulator